MPMHQLTQEQFKFRVFDRLAEISFLAVKTDASHGIDGQEDLSENELFVREAYENILGRKPDPLGLQHYLKALRVGFPRVLVLDSLYRSEEAFALERGAGQKPGRFLVLLHRARYFLLRTVIQPLHRMLARWLTRR